MKNPIDILIDGTKYPRAIEAKLPAAAPKISEALADIASKLPKVPDLPIDIPAPPVPEFPEFPEFPAPPGAELRRIVTGVEVTPTRAAPARAVAVSPEREKIPLVFE